MPSTLVLNDFIIYESHTYTSGNCSFFLSNNFDLHLMHMGVRGKGEMRRERKKIYALLYFFQLPNGLSLYLHKDGIVDGISNLILH